MSPSIVTPREPSVDIIRILSEGTYTSFPQALKEFISNASDAYASEVRFQFDEEFNSLTIRDDGEGMSKEDFVNVFASVGRSGRSVPPSKNAIAKKRMKIGRFGIGALAVVGTAQRFTVRSVKRGSRSGFEASVDLNDLKENYNQGKDLKSVWKFAMSDWVGEKVSTHFTEITLDGLRPDIRQSLERHGKSAGEFVGSISELSGLEELRWQLGVIAPVAYASGSPVPKKDLDSKKDTILLQKCKELSDSGFAVFLNGTPVTNPSLFPSYDPKKLSKASVAKLLAKRGEGFQIRCIQSPVDSRVSYTGYICVQAYQIFPSDARGILIRLRGVAVGWYRTLHFTASTTALLNSMSGEIWVDGLDEALQFDRESFREDHELFVWLKQKIQAEVDAETTEFRKRSGRRLKLQRGTSNAKETSRADKKVVKPEKPKIGLLPADIADSMPEYISRLVPQLNGSFDNGWYEGTAMILRRLVETLIIELYSRRGYQADIQEPETHEYIMLKALINKLNGDSRFGMQSRVITGLRSIKDLGDIATHDFRIRIRQTDLERIQSQSRVSIERLVFVVGAVAPRS